MMVIMTTIPEPPIELPALAEKCCHGEDAFPTSAVFATYGV
jgi:hypothetical protein